MPLFAVELIRLRPERTSVEIEAENLELLREAIKDLADDLPGWSAGTEAQLKYATATDADGKNLRLITF